MAGMVTGDGKLLAWSHAMAGREHGRGSRVRSHAMAGREHGRRSQAESRAMAGREHGTSNGRSLTGSRAI